MQKQPRQTQPEKALAQLLRMAMSARTFHISTSGALHLSRFSLITNYRQTVPTRATSLTAPYTEQKSGMVQTTGCHLPEAGLTKSHLSVQQLAPKGSPSIFQRPCKRVASCRWIYWNYYYPYTTWTKLVSSYKITEISHFRLCCLGLYRATPHQYTLYSL